METCFWPSLLLEAIRCYVAGQPCSATGLCVAALAASTYLGSRLLDIRTWALSSVFALITSGRPDLFVATAAPLQRQMAMPCRTDPHLDMPAALLSWHALLLCSCSEPWPLAPGTVPAQTVPESSVPFKIPWSALRWASGFGARTGNPACPGRCPGRSNLFGFEPPLPPLPACLESALVPRATPSLLQLSSCPVTCLLAPGPSCSIKAYCHLLGFGVLTP